MLYLRVSSSDPYIRDFSTGLPHLAGWLPHGPELSWPRGCKESDSRTIQKPLRAQDCCRAEGLDTFACSNSPLDTACEHVAIKSLYDMFSDNPI